MRDPSPAARSQDDSPASRAQDVHQRAIVIDGHSDILIPVTDGKMHLADRVSVPAPDTPMPLGMDGPFSKFGFSAHTMWFGCMGQYDLPRWRAGGITSQLCAIYLDDNWLRDPFRRGMEMAWNLHDQVARTDGLTLATTVKQIRQAKKDGSVALVLTFEGCDALANDPRMLDLYHVMGLRVASLTHTRRNAYADGCWAADKQGGLTALGRQVVERLNTLRIVIDLVHIGEVGFWEILEMSDRPVILWDPLESTCRHASLSIL